LLVNLILIIYLGLINISPLRFLVVYLSSGVVGNICAILTDERAVLRASGVVMSVLGYGISSGLKNNIDKSSIKELFNIVLLTIIPGLLLSCVSNGAHIGGLVSGLGLGLIYSSNELKTALSKLLRVVISLS
jgi:rhomboid protease GluP